jgi:hypothetical protein
MAAVSITIEPDELMGVCALLELEKAAEGGTASGPATADVTATARALMRKALAARLADSGLPWAPPPEAVQKRAAEAARPGSALRRLARDRRVRKYAASAVSVAALIVLWGGFIQGWKWTGFQQNEQLWNWLHLLLLPVVVGTIPLWLEHGEFISRTRSVTYLLIVAGFGILVAAGYVVPLKWTGFPGNTLWSWFQLILLPVALAAMGVWPSARRSLGVFPKAVIGVILASWAVTIVGGYDFGWTWTGYAGNTLWDWLQLLLLPVIIPLVLPRAVDWVSGSAARRAEEAHAAPELTPSAG